MATLRNKRKLAAVTRETQEENPRDGQSWNTSVPRINEEYITQVSEEVEGRVSKKLSQEFSRTESRILGALSKLDEFLSNQQIHTHFETVPGTFRNTNVENQGTNEDDSQSDPHPEAGVFRGQTTQKLGPKDCRDKNSFDLPTTPRRYYISIWSRKTFAISVQKADFFLWIYGLEIKANYKSNFFVTFLGRREWISVFSKLDAVFYFFSFRFKKSIIGDS